MESKLLYLAEVHSPGSAKMDKGMNRVSDLIEQELNCHSGRL